MPGTSHQARPIQSATAIEAVEQGQGAVADHLDDRSSRADDRLERARGDEDVEQRQSGGGLAAVDAEDVGRRRR